MILYYSLSVESHSSKVGINNIEIIDYNIICSKSWFYIVAYSVIKIDTIQADIMHFLRYCFSDELVFNSQ